jgi:acylphosphatase
MKELIRTTIIVHGDVQKGDYRGRVIKIAKKMGAYEGVGNITGVIQNLRDERMVKIIAEGERRDIDWFCDKIQIRNFLINVNLIKRDTKKDIEIDEDEREYEEFNKIVNEGETDERLDKATELLKDLAEEMGNGFKQMEKGFKEQREYSMKFDSYIFEQTKHNARLDAILEKLAEK